MENQVEIIAKHCLENLDFSPPILSNSYYYNSLPFCVIDSIFSIGVKYQGVVNVVDRFSKNREIPVYRPIRNELPNEGSQYTVTHFIRDFNSYSPGELALDIFKNKQRTSTRNGILKAEAVTLFMNELFVQGVNHFQDLHKLNTDFDEAIKKIPGQKSGISLSYFYMLSGSENFIKPDRMILRYIEDRTNRKVSTNDATHIILKVQTTLVNKYNLQITPRELDHLIWNYQRDNS